MIKNLTYTVAALVILTTGALASAETVHFQRSAFNQGGSHNGGEFIAHLSGGGTYRTFCLEINEPISLGNNGNRNYSFDITTDGAVDGGVSRGTPDPVSSATASIFVAWLNGSITRNPENSTAVQNAIWALEGEIDSAGLTGIAMTLYTNAVLAWPDLGDNAATSGNFSNIRVLNPYRIIDGERFDYQSQIILIPLPGAWGLALAGFALCATRRR